MIHTGEDGYGPHYANDGGDGFDSERGKCGVQKNA